MRNYIFGIIRTFLTHETLSYVNHIVANILGLVYATITHLIDTELEKK